MKNIFFKLNVERPLYDYLTYDMKTITHRPFLAEVMERFHKYAPSTLAQWLFIFPTQLSIDYFPQCLDKEKWQGSAMPTCVTLSQCILAHSTIRQASTLVLAKELHTLANQILNRKASFEQFYGWGITLLKDFDSLDQYLINSSALFLALMRQKQLTVPVEARSFLDQYQLEAFQKSSDLSLFQQKEDVLFWERLPLLYQAFTEKLIQQGKGYEGLCYRMVSDRILSETMASYQKIIFVGFNLLSPAEEQFIVQCKALAPVAFFWDMDAHYLDNPINVAGNYLRKHRQKDCFQESFSTTYGTYLDDVDKKVVITEMCAAVTQVQAVTAALEEKTEEGKPRFLPMQTAIVVSGTELLIPLLDRLSSLSIQLHCRLPYPLSATVVYSLVERLVGIWEQSIRTEPNEIYTNLANSLALFRPFVGAVMQEEITSILQGLPKSSACFEVCKHPLGPFVLWFNGHHKGLFAYLQEILCFMEHHFTHAHNLFLDLNRTALQYILAYIEPLVEMDSAGERCSIPFFWNGLKESTMLFHQNNPFTGLYVVEIAQSHNVDFEHVFFMNMSEGYFPKLSHNDSFLPYHLRNSFGLPLLDEVAESVTSYGFYRLLQRAQNVYCSYAKQNNLDPSSEMSRLLLQLSFDSKLKIIQESLPINLSESSTPAISIEKDGMVMQLLEKFLVKETASASSITPAALISYLRCPLQFYFVYLLKLRQTSVPKDIEEAVQLGTLFHNVMERLYRPFIGMQIDPSIVIHLKSKINIEVKEVVATQLAALGNHIHLLTALLEKLLERVLALDYAATPFTLLGVEVGRREQMAVTLDLDQERKVRLSGIIDRIDMKGDAIRVVDYKTGAASSKISSIAALFDSAEIKKNGAIFQLIFYAWLFKSMYKADHQKSIMPYLINIRALFSDAYTPGIFIQAPGGAKKYRLIEDMMDYVQPFEEGLSTLLLEIFDPAHPFMQTQDLEVCTYCPYVGICQRD